MKNLLEIMLNGAYDNLKRILFASDRVTDIEMRNAILNGEIKPEEKVNEHSCIGCGGCANVCPTGAITMKTLQRSVKLSNGWEKTEVPELDPLKCVVCYWCHDFCPVYALYEEAGSIHPNNVGDSGIDPDNLMTQPIRISEDKMAFIAQYISDKSVLSQKNIVVDTDDDLSDSELDKVEDDLNDNASQINEGELDES